MPITDGRGHSSMTPDKQSGLSAMLALHMRVVGNVFHKNRWMHREYYYIDTNAGSGSNPEEGVPGSPLIFLDRIKQFGYPWHAHFIECEAANVLMLKQRLNGECGNSIHVHHDNNACVVPEILRHLPGKSFGLVYMDPNGTPNWELLTTVSKERPKLDILIRCPTRVLKRTRYQGAPSLVDGMKMVGKEAWLIREPIHGDRHDWTFLFGADYGFGEWGKERFYRTNSNKGKELLERLHYTKPEIEEMHQCMLFVEQAVKDRSGGVCERCGEAPATEIHHKKGSYGQMDPLKRVHLCNACHCIVEGVTE